MAPDQRDQNGVWLPNTITKEDLDVADVADEICWMQNAWVSALEAIHG